MLTNKVSVDNARVMAGGSDEYAAILTSGILIAQAIDRLTEHINEFLILAQRDNNAPVQR
jgi:hypothetical protein